MPKKTFDAIVVGGGSVGVPSAYNLAQRGLKVLVLDLVMGLPSKVSTTTSNLIIGVTALAGTSVYLAAGLVDPGQVAPVVLGVVAGAFVGTQLLVRLRNRTVRNLFTVVLFVLGIEMIVRTALGGK